MKVRRNSITLDVFLCPLSENALSRKVTTCLLYLPCISFVYEPKSRWFRYYVLFIFFLFLSIMIFNFIYVVSYISTFFNALLFSIIWINCTLLIHPHVDEHMGCSQSGTIINTVAINILVCFFGGHLHWFLLSLYLEVEFP